MKLIDVDELRKYIGLSERCEDCDRDKIACQYDQVFTRMDFCGWIDEQPEAVVRCKDCIHDNDCAIQDIAQTGFNFFCGCAERRTDE